MNDKTTTEETTTVSEKNSNSPTEPEKSISESVMSDADFSFCPYGRCYTD